MYEYRKRFCDEPTTAYLYLSAPVQEVVGIMELGKPIHTTEKFGKCKKCDDIYNSIYDIYNRDGTRSVTI